MEILRRSTPLLVCAGLVAVLAVAATACVPGRTGAEDAVGDTDATAVDGPTQSVPIKPDQLVTAFTHDAVICDGTDRPLGEIRGALPGERILFDSPAPVTLPETVADQSGRFRMAWNCDPSEARLQWEVRALGHDSGHEVTFTINGTSAEAVSAGGLTLNLFNEPVVCDGTTHRIGSIGNAFPGEQIIFTSPESNNIRPGTADDFGDLNVNWECEPNEAGSMWNINAAGAQSGRIGDFVVAGVAITPEVIEDLVVTIVEEPFVCDGNSRPAATMGNFAPDEVVKFSSPDSDNLIDGTADGLGDINVNWQCGLDDVGKTWSLTAIGVVSQRTATVTITGGAPADVAALDPEVIYVENPFGCDGGTRQFATITNLVPREFVDFTSPQSEALRQGQADQNGALAVNWQCGAADIDMIWDITATGATSGRTASLQLVGGTPANG